MKLSIELYFFIALIVVLLLLLVFIVRMLRSLQKKHYVSTIVNSLYCLVILLVIGLFALMISNLLSYQRLTYEQPIALLSVKPLNAQRAQIDFMSYHDCAHTSYILQGDEWQVDTHIVKFHSWANLLGLDSFYQLDRISGRYADIEQQRRQLPSVFKLQQKTAYDLWKLKNKYYWLPGFDAQYGQSVFLPMNALQHYQITLGQSGLLVREVPAVGICYPASK